MVVQKAELGDGEGRKRSAATGDDGVREQDGVSVMAAVLVAG